MANTVDGLGGEKIDLNTATFEDLRRICHIRPDFARKVLEERNRRGGFKDIDDLRSVPGIGPVTVHLLRARAYVSETSRDGA